MEKLEGDGQTQREKQIICQSHSKMKYTNMIQMNAQTIGNGIKMKELSYDN